MQVSIIIPVYNALALARACVASIYEAGSAVTYEIIVVDNGSAPDVEEWLHSEEQHRPNLRHLRYAQPLGFARAVNRGAAVAAGHILIVLNSDTLVTQGWVEGLSNVLQANPALGAVTPNTNQAGEPAQMDFSTIDLHASAALALRAKKSLTPDILYLPQRLTFFCVAFRRDVWMEMQGLDEAYGIGNFEDDDLCLRLRVAGYRLGVARHLFVYHHNNATFYANGISHGALLEQNTAVFAEHARAYAERQTVCSPRWPKRAATEISVIVLPATDGALGRTLRSLENQTVQGFELIGPGSRLLPTRSWIAYITQGDIVYPFHLEALLEALERHCADSIFADFWSAATLQARVHPDAARPNREAPLNLSGWMHHASLDRDRLWEQSVPVHWPRLTWEMRELPPAPPPSRKQKRRGIIDPVRQLYRRSVRLETRLALDARVRSILKLPKSDPDQMPLHELTARLEPILANGAAAGQFAINSVLPAVMLFNAVPWHSAVQRQHHFARGLARLGHPVFWVDTDLSPPRSWRTDRPLQQIAPGVYLIRLPSLSRDIYHLQWTAAATDAMCAALLILASAYGLRDVVTLINYPRWQPVAMRLRERAGWRVIYDCLDDQAALAELYQTQLLGFEEELLKGANLLLTSSAVLQDRMRLHSPILLHNAADYDLFSSARSLGQLKHLRRPVIGFFGALADWLDTDLIRAAALEFPDWSFVYIGPNVFSQEASEAKWMRSTDLPNITVLPQMDLRTLAGHLADFDVCTMPFLDLPVTRTMNPVKLYEYLAAGKPAVSRDLPEVRHLLQSPDGAADLVVLYSTPLDFFNRLREAVAANSPEQAARRQHFARRNDWRKRVEVLSRKIIELTHAMSSSNASSSGSKTLSQE